MFSGQSGGSVFSQKRRLPSRPPSAAPVSSFPSSRSLALPRSTSGGFGKRTLAPFAGGSSTVADKLARELRTAEAKVDKTLLKDEMHAVTVAGQVPAEVQEMLSKDVNIDQTRARVDYATGFALAWSRTTCHVWNSTRRGFSAPTIYSFPCPPPPVGPSDLLVQSLASLPFVFLLPLASSREPALLLVTPRGSLRLWSSLSLALSNPDKFQSLQISLNEKEVIKCLVPIRGLTGQLVAGTSDNRVVRLAVVVGAAGHPAILSSALAKGWSFAGGVSSLFRGSADIRAGVSAISTSPGDVWVMESTKLYRWKLTPQGGEAFIGEWDLAKDVGDSLASETVDLIMLEALAIEWHDVKLAADGSPVVLVSYNSRKSADEPSPRPRSYALIIFNASSSASKPIVSHCILASTRTYPDPAPRPDSSPYLVLPQGGPAAFAVLPNRVLCLSLEPDSQFEEVVDLKAISMNRIIGSGYAEDLKAGLGSRESPELMVVTTEKGLLKIEVRLGMLTGAAQAERGDDKDTAKLKTKLSQAVFFGGDNLNPIAFEFTDYRGNLDTAARAVSAEILSSSSVELAGDSTVNILRNIEIRQTYVTNLRLFLDHTGLLRRIAPSTRRQLSTDAEKLSAANKLWATQNARMQLASAPTLLAEAVTAYMHAQGLARDADDVLRLFFRAHVVDLPAVADRVQALWSTRLANETSIKRKSGKLLEANEFYMDLYGTTLQGRPQHVRDYALHDDKSEPWTSTNQMLNNLQACVDTTVAVLKARARDLGLSLDSEDPGLGFNPHQATEETPKDSAVVQAALKVQLSTLAEYLLSMYNERGQYLLQNDPSGVEFKALNARHMQTRPNAIKSLIDIGRVSDAFKLGEHYRDHRTLVEMCHSRQGELTRIPLYMRNFGKDFANELYQWYIEQGKFHCLLDQEEQYASLLTEFLDSSNYQNVAWVHDLFTRRFDRAAGALLDEAMVTKSLSQQHLMLSIGKLAIVATSNSETLESEPDLLREPNARIDVNASHTELRKRAARSLSPQDSMKALDSRIDCIRSKVAPHLADRPAFSALVARSLKSIFEGTVLSAEDLIDTWTLAECEREGHEAGRFVLAYELHQRSNELAAGRAQLLLQSLWRRVLLHEDWQALRASSHLSDAQIATCLRQTVLYDLLSHIHANKMEGDAAPILQPSQAFFAGSSEDLAARFADAGPGAVEALLADYEKENEDLRAALERGGLTEYFAEVVRLVAEDSEAQALAQGVSEQEGDASAEMMQE